MWHTKKFYIISAVVLLVAGIGWRQYRRANQSPEYETVRVERGDLVQTVEATGQVESAQDLSLRFETGGVIADVRVKEGQQVKAGDWLANLQLAELNAVVAKADADLNLKLAGPSASDRQYYEAAVDSAKASWEQAKVEEVTKVAAAEADVSTAKNNLKLAEGGDNSELVNNSYEDMVAVLHTSLSVLDDGLTQADNILGVDNTLSNDDFESVLSILDTGKLATAKSHYITAKLAISAARQATTPLTSDSPHASVDSGAIKTKRALEEMNVLLSDVAVVLNSTSPIGSLTQSSLNTKKTTVETARGSVSAQYTALINQEQAIFDAKNSYQVYLIGYNKSLQNLEEVKASVSNAVAVKKAAYDQALANLHSKIDPPREVDVAAYRAALAQAVANRNKAIIRAPIDGVVTKVYKKKGETIALSEDMIKLLSPHYEIKVDIPETDVSKLQVGNTTTITLDAFGDENKFYGRLAQIDPASTEIQDVVYYQVTVALDPSDQPIKSGMTANVVFYTARRDGVLSIPARAVRTNGSKYVRVLTDGVVSEVPIKLGLKADDGRVEVVSGLEEGTKVILSSLD